MAIVDYFLKIDAIAGGSTDDAHKDELEVLSFSWGVSSAGSMAHGSGGGEGKATFHDMHFTHTIDKSSPVLMKSCASGEHLKSAVLVARRSSSEGKGQEFLKITLSDVLVSSYQVSGHDTVGGRDLSLTAALATSDNVSGASSSDASAPLDAVSLAYASAKFAEGPQQHINVRPGAAGQITFDPRTGDFEIKDTPTGVVHVGGQSDALTDAVLIMRAVQEYDVTDVLGLLNAPFDVGTLTLTVSEVRPTPGSTENPTESVVPDPNLHFDVLLYAPADLELTPGDITRKGKLLGSLHVDPRGDPASLELDLTDEVREGTFGIRLQLRGHPVKIPVVGDAPLPGFDTEDAEDVDTVGGQALGQSRGADFTIDLAFDSK